MAAKASRTLWRALDGQHHGLSAEQIRRRLPILRFRGGRPLVEVRLTAVTAGVEAALVAAGLEIDRVSRHHARVYGAMDLERLDALVAVPQVATVHPDYGALAVELPERGGARSLPLPGEASDWAARGPIGVFAGELDAGGGASVDGSCGPLLPAASLRTAAAPARTGDGFLSALSDLLPGAGFFLRPGQTGLAELADGIAELSRCGANTLVDNLRYFAQPVFREGVREQAVREAEARGATYISVADYLETPRVDGLLPGLDPMQISPGRRLSEKSLHEFGGGDRFATVTLPAACSLTLVLQWDEPFAGTLGPGAASDVDLYLCSDEDAATCRLAAGDRQGCGIAPGVLAGDPLEIVRYDNLGESSEPVHIGILRRCGGGELPYRLLAYDSGCEPEYEPGLFERRSSAKRLPDLRSTGSITVTEPNGVSDRIPESRDYATHVLGDSWDMANAEDVVLTESKNISGESFAGGVYSGTSATAAPEFWLTFPGLVSTVKLSDGALLPVDTSVYRYFSARVRYSGTVNNQSLVLYFYDDGSFSPGTFGNSKIFAPRPVPGQWTTVTFDLLNDIGGSSQAQWTDFPLVRGLRVNPSFEAGVTFEFDWIRLTADDGVSAKTIEWTASGTGSTFSIDAIDTVGTSFNLASSVAGDGNGANSENVDLGLLPPGGYTLRVQAGGDSGDSCAGCLEINQTPVLSLLEPDRRGDVANDYATVVLGNPWGPMDSGDVITNKVEDFENVTYVGGCFEGDSTPPSGAVGDPRILMNTCSTPVANPMDCDVQAIDTKRYRMLSYELEVSGTKDVGVGSVTRVLWGDDLAALTTSDDVVVEEGLNEYVVGDLDEVPLADAVTVGQWNGTVDFFRFDPHEFPTTRHVTLCSVRLAPVDEAAPTFTFDWSDADTDDDATIQLWLDRDEDPDNGNELSIVSGLSEDALDSYLWDASTTAAGEYQVLAEISDPFNSTRRYATGPLRVACSSPQDAVYSNEMVSALDTRSACNSITAGTDFRVVAGGDLLFRAGAMIALDNGFSVQAGQFGAEIDSLLLP